MQRNPHHTTSSTERVAAWNARQRIIARLRRLERIAADRNMPALQQLTQLHIERQVAKREAIYS